MREFFRSAERRALAWAQRCGARARVVFRAYPAAVTTGLTLLAGCIMAFLLLRHGAGMRTRDPLLSYAAVSAYYSWAASAVALIALQVAYALFVVGTYAALLGVRTMAISGCVTALTIAVFFVFALAAPDVATESVEPAVAHQLLQAVAALDIVCFLWARMGLDALHSADRGDRLAAAERWRTQLRFESAWLTVAAVQVGLNYRLVVESGYRSHILDRTNLTEAIVAMGVLLSIVLAIGHLAPLLYYAWRHPIPGASADASAKSSWWSSIAPIVGRFVEVAAPAVVSFLLGFFGAK